MELSYLKRKYRIGLIGIAIILLLLITSCAAFVQNGSFLDDEVDNIQQPTDNVLPTDEPEDPVITPEVPVLPSGTTSLSLRAVGDIMMHGPQVTAGLQADGSYEFKHFFDDIKPYLEGADIVMGNLETTVSNDEKGYGGYPLFRTPESMLEALVHAGFQVITTANNHSFDGREFGVTNTLDKLDEYGLLHTGTARTSDERNQVLIVEKNDIKVGILAYTYGTNGMEATVSEENLPFMVNDIDRDRIKEDVNRTRDAGAEILITSIHWGDEYARKPNDFQIETTDYLASLGVDIILGSHPYVLQPMERRPVTLEDGSEKEIFIIYSLGNFISNQREQYRDSGVIIDLEIIKNYDQNTIQLANIAYTPTWVYRFLNNGKSDFRVLPVGQFMEEGLSGDAKQRINTVWNETTTHLSQEGFQIKE